MKLPGEVKALIALALAEDIGSGDLTSDLLATAEPGSAEIVARQLLRMAGGPVARRVFQEVNPAIEVELLVSDGEDVEAGQRVLLVHGSRRSIFTAERTVLNFLGRLSGVATLTREYVVATADSTSKIVDTRKTIPGFRWLDKYAVRMGGGVNHRMGLYDELLVKDNHIDALGGMKTVTEALGKARPPVPLTIECRHLTEVLEALELPPDLILLDNMSAEDVLEVVEAVDGRCCLEASGGISLEDIIDLAATGVDRISIGRLTHSAPCADFSLLWLEKKGR